MIDFPANPTVGQEFSSGGSNWVWDGVKWVGVGGGPFLPTDGTSPMVGPLILAEDPVEPLEAGTKQYIDSKGSAEGIPIGGILIWPGSTAIGQGGQGAPPPNYLLCDGGYYLPADAPFLFDIIGGGYGWDGTNFAVPNLLDRVPVGAGSSYGLSALGGESSHVLDGNELTSHAHSVYDPTHAHSLADPGHTHGIGDPGHGHGFPDPGHAHSYTGWYTPAVNIAGGSGGTMNGQTTGGSGTGRTIQGAGTGIWTGAAGTSMGVYGAGTGIQTYGAGSSWGHNNMQPYIALYFYIRYE